MGQPGFDKRPDVPDEFKHSAWWKQAPVGYEDKDDGLRWWYRVTPFSSQTPWEYDPATRGGQPIEPVDDSPDGFREVFPKPTTTEFGGATAEYTRRLNEWNYWKKHFLRLGISSDWDPESVQEARAVVGSWGMGTLQFFQTTGGDWWAIFPDVDPRMRYYMERPEALTREKDRRGDAFSPDNIVADYQEQLFKRFGTISRVLHPFLPPVLLGEMVGDKFDETPVKEIVNAGPRTDRGENWADVLNRVLAELRRQAELAGSQSG